MNIDYRNSIGGISAAQLCGFFEGWPNPPSPEAHQRLLEGSFAVVVAFDDDLDRVVGFITAISDGVLAAYVPLLEVLPSHRGRGIGSELVRRLFDRLSDHYMIDVVCDPELVGFYERFGLSKLAGMAKRNMPHQAGRAER